VRACPCCGRGNFVTRYSSFQIREEIDARASFVNQWFDHKPKKIELMDLTEFMHGGPGRLLACAHCGLLRREEDSEPHYADDVYDPDLLNHLYPRYVAAFRAKEKDYRDLLPPRAGVVELGSHVGAFLEVAERWDWRPIGLDIGRYTSAFARSKGLTVRRKAIEDSSLRGHGLDALFIWNCFEQMEDPGSTLRSAQRLLKPHGLLVVRVPNVKFYERWRAQGARRAALRGLAYNNLLGFPYLFGYSPPALLRLLARNGFEPFEWHNSSLLTIPFPDLPAVVERESSVVNRVLSSDRASLTGPWIEVVCRSVINQNGELKFAAAR